VIAALAEKDLERISKKSREEEKRIDARSRLR
jgi:hypothetical protein